MKTFKLPPRHMYEQIKNLYVYSQNMLPNKNSKNRIIQTPRELFGF